MKILHISSAKSFGGGERYLADLVNALAARGDEVYVAVRPGSPVPTELKLPPENLLEIPLRNALDAKSASALFRFVKQRKIQIVHAHMARDYPLAAYAARRNKATRLIVTRHVLFPLNRLHAITLRGVGRVIAVSAAVARHLQAQRLIPENRITVVNNGIDLERVASARSRFDRDAFLSRWDLPEKSLLIGSVGALTPLKGHDDFLRAASLIKGSFPHAFFIIAGTDSSPNQSHRIQLERMITELGLVENIRMIGWMDDLASLFCALDVFVSASHTESFGLAIVEAMVAGAAVVTTATEGAKEIIQDGETGMLVPIGDFRALAEAVNALVSDDSKREHLCLQAQRAATSRFSLERMVEETARIYSEVLKGSVEN
ncbi:MAG: glycosyltransferase family 4 protein [bacterium]